MRDIGAAGESYFRAWCASAGITANPSQSDAHGWDMLIEMQTPGMSLNTSQLHEGMVEGKVQIKSTDSRKRYVDVELSNLHKMATTSLPAFFVLIEFEGSDAPSSAYIRHVDEALISQVLKRIADLTAENSKVKLNKKSLRVHFSEEVTPLTPGTLKALMQKHIGTTQSAYVEKKLQHLKSAGFEDGAYKLRFTIPNVEQLERLIDASLGKQVGVEVESIQGSAVRFGLSSPIPALAASTAVLSLMQVVPDGQGTVSFRKRSNGTTYSFPADLYRGLINGLLPMDRRKIRIDAGFLEITVKSKGDVRNTEAPMEVTINLQLTKPIEIEDLLKAYNVFQLLRTPKGVDFGLDFFGIQSSFGLNASDSFEDCSFQIATLKMIVDIKRHFEWTEPLLLTLDDIQPEIRNLEVSYPVFMSQSNDATLTYEAGDNPPVGIEADCLYVVSIKLGQYLFVKILVIRGVAEKVDDGSEKIDGQIIDSIFKAVFKVTDGASKIKADIEYAAHSYESDRPIFNFSPVFINNVLGIPHEETAVNGALDSSSDNP